MTAPVTDSPSQFVSLLREQVRHEFNASQQYIAIAVWYDAHDLPQLAGHFYRQATEERHHAMMIVQWMLDRELSITIPGVDEVRGDFLTIVEPIALRARPGTHRHRSDQDPLRHGEGGTATSSASSSCCGSSRSRSRKWRR